MDKMKIVPVKIPWMISPAYEIEKYFGGTAFVNITLNCLNSKKQQNKIISRLNNLYNNNIPEDILKKFKY